MEHFGVELRHERLQLVDRVQDLDALGVRIEADLEGTRHAGHPPTELLLGIFEALGDEVDWLILLILVRLDSCLCGVEWTVLGLVAHRVQQLAIGGQQTGTIGFDLVVFFAQAKLNCKPVNLLGE